jgi:hypothetical protein
MYALRIKMVVDVHVVVEREHARAPKMLAVLSSLVYSHAM